jgi:hypothetical protein
MTTTIAPRSSRPRHSVIHELDHRSNDGMDVRLLWNSGTNQVSIAVVDGRAGEWFAFEVGPADAVDAFHHPYAYAPRRQPLAPKPAQEGLQEPVADADDGSPRRRMIGRVRAPRESARRRQLPPPLGAADRRRRIDPCASTPCSTPAGAVTRDVERLRCSPAISPASPSPGTSTTSSRA